MAAVVFADIAAAAAAAADNFAVVVAVVVFIGCCGSALITSIFNINNESIAKSISKLDKLLELTMMPCTRLNTPAAFFFCMPLHGKIGEFFR